MVLNKEIMKKNYSNNVSLKKQSGVILILSLVILLVLTMLIVTSMNATNTQVLLTGNTQYHTQALNDAETVLRIAESEIDKFATDINSQPNTGYYNVKANNNIAIDFANFQWSPQTAATQLVGTRPSLFVIEYIGIQAGKGQTIGEGQNADDATNVEGEEKHLYRITARSTSARGALRLVQSVYYTIAQPL